VVHYAVAEPIFQTGNSEFHDTGQQRLIEYGIGAQILLDLGVREMVLLSNSPARKIVGLEGYGLKVVGHRSLESKAS